MEDKNNSFKKRISEMTKEKEPIKDNNTLMKKIGENARIALKIMKTKKQLIFFNIPSPFFTTRTLL